MENRIKVLNLLGLARRASKLVTGQELVLSRIRSNKVNIVFVASDSGKIHWNNLLISVRVTMYFYVSLSQKKS